MGKKILLADDSITIQKVIELTFSDEDFEVVTVGNGRLAIEKVQDVRPDVVLCDVIMPEKDGYEVCEFIKKSPQLGQIPVLLLTGAFEPFDQERAARVGCDGFLAKPFEPDTLIAKVKDLLSKAAARHAGGPPRPPAPPVAEVHVPAPPPPAPAASHAPFTTAPAAPAAPPPFTSTPHYPPTPPAFAATSPEPAVIEDPEMAFIPDEPFEDLETPSFDSSAVLAAPAYVDYSSTTAETAEDLVPMTPEESESLSSAGGDASATVMFRADSLPWSAAATSAPATPPVQESEPATDPELPLFEEVIEETEVQTEAAAVLMSSQPAMPPPPPESVMPPPPPLVTAPAFTPPPVVPPPVPVAAPAVTPAPVMVPPPAPAAAPAFTPAPVMPPPVPASAPAFTPAPVVPPPPVAAPPVFTAPPPPPPVHAPMPPPVLGRPSHPEPPPPPPAPVHAPMPPPVLSRPSHPEPPPPPPPQAPAEASSFADVAASIQEPAPEPPNARSLAAQVDVPIEMVEKIAQRVVAQLSEKVVERIAWEVIPDLAEALIKREIERLKAELQQL